MNAAFLAVLLATAAFVPLMHEGDAVPALPLVDQSGRAFSLQELRGNAVVLSFVYTRCADARMCPLVSAKFARLQRAIGDAPIRLVELTLDPTFDTPAVLARYGAAFGQRTDRWTLATGAPASIDELALRFGIATARTSATTLVHTEAAIVLDPHGAIARIIDGNTWTTDDLLAVARQAAGDRPAPLALASLWLTQTIERCGGPRGSFTTIGGLALLALSIAGSALALSRAFASRTKPKAGEG